MEMATLDYPQYGLNSLVRTGRRFAKARTRMALDLETGRRSPWDLPEWRPDVEGYQKEYSRGLGDLARNFTRTGVTGPAAGLGMERAGDQYSGGLLQLPQQIRQSYAGEGWKGAQMGEGIREFDKSHALQKLQTLLRYEIENKKNNPSTLDKITQIMGATGQLMGGAGGAMAAAKGCCFIFLEGNNGVLEDSVRKFRDKCFPPDSRVARGYKMMARWLVPFMRKSSFIKKVVKTLMLDPLARVARWYKGNDKYGWMFIPVGIFWCLIWGESARLKGIYDKLYRSCIQRREVVGANA